MRAKKCEKSEISNAHFECERQMLEIYPRGVFKIVISFDQKDPMLLIKCALESLEFREYFECLERCHSVLREFSEVKKFKKWEKSEISNAHFECENGCWFQEFFSKWAINR